MELMILAVAIGGRQLGKWLSGGCWHETRPTYHLATRTVRTTCARCGKEWKRGGR